MIPPAAVSLVSAVFMLVSNPASRAALQIPTHSLQTFTAYCDTVLTGVRVE